MKFLKSFVVLFTLQIYAACGWNIEATFNPGCDDSCMFTYPNLVYIRAEDKTQSIHYFATASKTLGPPSVFVARSSDPSAVARINWTRLTDFHKYDAISIENVTDINGMSYLSIVDFRDKTGHGNLWSMMENNLTLVNKDKPYIEYYLSQFDFTAKHVDTQPDKKTGLLHVLFQSDSNRKHRLVWDGGFIQIKVTVTSKPENISQLLSTESRLLPLIPGLSFRLEISFHNLTTQFPDSQFGVSVVLFSNKTLTPSADFITQSIFLPAGLQKTKIPISRVSEAYLNQHSKSDATFLNMMLNENADHNRTTSSPTLNVAFRPGPLSFLGEGEEVHQTVLMGPRKPLTRARRNRLKCCLGKALFGQRFSQPWDAIRPEKWQLSVSIGHGGVLPIGMRVQYFSFMRHDKLSTASLMKWPSLMTMEYPSQPTVGFSEPDHNSIMSWGLMVLNWITFPFQ